MQHHLVLTVYVSILSGRTAASLCSSSADMFCSVTTHHQNKKKKPEQPAKCLCWLWRLFNQIRIQMIWTQAVSVLVCCIDFVKLGGGGSFLWMIRRVKSHVRLSVRLLRIRTRLRHKRQPTRSAGRKRPVEPESGSWLEEHIKQLVFPAILWLEFFVPTGRSTGAAEAIVYREMKGGRRESRPLRWLNWIQRALTGNDFTTANAGATRTHRPAADPRVQHTPTTDTWKAARKKKSRRPHTQTLTWAMPTGNEAQLRTVRRLGPFGPRRCCKTLICSSPDREAFEFVGLRSASLQSSLIKRSATRTGRQTFELDNKEKALKFYKLKWDCERSPGLNNAIGPAVMTIYSCIF